MNNLRRSRCNGMLAGSKDLLAFPSGREEIGELQDSVLAGPFWEVPRCLRGRAERANRAAHSVGGPSRGGVMIRRILLALAVLASLLPLAPAPSVATKATALAAGGGYGRHATMPSATKAETRAVEQALALVPVSLEGRACAEHKWPDTAQNTIYLFGFCLYVDKDDPNSRARFHQHNYCRKDPPGATSWVPTHCNFRTLDSTLRNKNCRPSESCSDTSPWGFRDWGDVLNQTDATYTGGWHTVDIFLWSQASATYNMYARFLASSTDHRTAWYYGCSKWVGFGADTSYPGCGIT
jgi:hypothetical protein